MKIINEGGSDELIDFIAQQTMKFVMVNFPSTPNQSLVASEFASDLLEQKKDWKKDDVRLFFKFVRTQSIEEIKVYGNMITPIKLFELVRYYEEDKSDKRVVYQRSLKQDIDLNSNNPNVQKYIELIKENIKPTTPKPSPAGAKLHAFDPVLHEKDFETFIALLNDFSKEDKDKWRLSIYNAETIDEKPAKRREQLLELLK